MGIILTKKINQVKNYTDDLFIFNRRLNIAVEELHEHVKQVKNREFYHNKLNIYIISKKIKSYEKYCIKFSLLMSRNVIKIFTEQSEQKLSTVEILRLTRFLDKFIEYLKIAIIYERKVENIVKSCINVDDITYLHDLYNHLVLSINELEKKCCMKQDLLKQVAIICNKDTCYDILSDKETKKPTKRSLRLQSNLKRNCVAVSEDIQVELDKHVKIKSLDGY